MDWSLERRQQVSPGIIAAILYLLAIGMIARGAVYIHFYEGHRDQRTELTIGIVLVVLGSVMFIGATGICVFMYLKSEKKKMRPRIDPVTHGDNEDSTSPVFTVRYPRRNRPRSTHRRSWLSPTPPNIQPPSYSTTNVKPPPYEVSPPPPYELPSAVNQDDYFTSTTTGPGAGTSGSGTQTGGVYGPNDDHLTQNEPPPAYSAVEQTL